MTLPTEQTKLLFIESVQSMLERFKEIEERYPNDSEGRDHHTWKELLYWYANREVNPKF